MKNNNYKPFIAFALKCIVIVLLSGNVANVVMAQDAPRTSISKIMASVNSFTNNLSVEKLYLQTDKPSYSAGDTLWFKAYLFDASYFNASSKSGVLYLEIANDSNRVMKRVMLPVYSGLTFGNITLDGKELPQGGYLLRAYTNWMRNFGEDYVFKKHFYLSNATDNDWLINYNAHLAKDAGRDKIRIGLKFNQFDEAPVGLREMQVRVTEGRKTWFKNNVQTGIDGLLDVNFDFPEKANPKNLSLQIRDMRKGEGNRELLVPVILNRPENIDLQFMPEGGNLVANLPAHIAFKAINEDGLGTNVSGNIYNSKGQEVAAFSSIHKGIGTFNLLPQSGEIYSAKIKLPNGLYKTYPLPQVKTTGTALQINNPFQKDSIKINLNATADIVAAGNNYYLIGEARGIVCYGAAFNFNNGAVKISVGKKTFPSGIARFTLIGPDKNALNERIIFIDHDDNLNIQLSSNKKLYRQKDSVALSIRVSDKDGMPVQGSFSLAVTDDGQVKTDSITGGSIITQMLLAADLKGNIEDPGYYVHTATNVKKWQDTDQLLLAQGWVGYDWNEVFKPAKPFAYAAEPGFIVQGKVTNMFNKPVARSGVNLFSKRPALLLDTITNNEGDFTFKGIFPADTAVFFIQAKNKKGKSFNVGIEMDEFKPPVFTATTGRILPWYVNVDTGRLVIVNKQVRLKKDLERATGAIVLKEVVIKAKRIIKDSKNLNGPGEADLVVDEQELEKAGRTTLGNLLEKRVKGFGYRTDKSGLRYYSINTMPVHLIIDGMDIEFFHPEGISLFEYFKQYLDYYDAEEIKGIEVMYSGRYQMRYGSKYLLNPMDNPFEHAFIEVTTRGGKGPFVKKSVGTYVFRPMPFSLPKKFYSPKYNSNSTANLTDIRSTIYWEPDIITDKEGKAIVKFYTTDNPGSYSLIIEGSDMQGNLGVKRAQIIVKK